MLFSFTPLAYADSVQVLMMKGSSTNQNCVQCFFPNTVSVNVGDKVTWKNVDSASHTATASDGHTFDTGLVNADSTGTVAFSTSGTYQYACVVHPWMKGTVVVGDPSVPITPTTPPEQNPIPPSTDSPTEIRLTINGKIDPTNINKKLDVTLQIVGILIDGQSDNTVSVKQVRLQSDGTFNDSIILGGPLWVNYGDYKIIARYGSLKADTTFTFDGKSTSILATLPALEQPVETKKGVPISDTPIKTEQPTTQDVTTQLTFSGKIGQSSVQAGYDVTLQIFGVLINGQSNNMITQRQVQVLSDGSYTDSFTIGGPLWKDKGDYKLVTKYGALTAQSVFSYDGKSSKISITLPTIGKQSGGQLVVPNKVIADVKKSTTENQKQVQPIKQQPTATTAKSTPEKAKPNTIVPQVAKQVTKSDDIKKIKELAKQKAKSQSK